MTVLFIPGEQTLARWSDEAHIPGTTLHARKLSKLQLSCSGGLLTAPQFSWSAPLGYAPTSYLVEYSGSESGQATVHSTQWTLPSNLINLGGSYSVTVEANYKNWSSPISDPRIARISLSVLGLFASSSC